MNKQQWAWSLFDFAMQPFHTVIVTFIFIPYFVDTIIGDPIQGQSIVGLMTAFSSFFIAFSAPLLGTFLDRGASRRLWMLGLSGLYVYSLTYLTLAPLVAPIVLSYVVAMFAAETLLVTANSYLPYLTTKENIGKVSSMAWGLGYTGGLIVLFIYLLLLMPAPGGDKTFLLGLVPLLGDDAPLYSGLISALWYIIFMIPFFYILPAFQTTSDSENLFTGFVTDLASSFKIILKDRALGYFFLSSILGRDALGGIFTFGAIYAKAVLEWSFSGLAAFGIFLNLMGFFGGWLGALLDRRLGSERILQASLWIFFFVMLVVLSTDRTQVFFIPLSEETHLPDYTFWVCGLFIGLAAGSIQGSMRGLVVKAAEGKIEIGKAFGVYGTLGRATAFLTPIFVAIVTNLSNSTRYGLAPIALLLLASIYVFSLYRKHAR